MKSMTIMIDDDLLERANEQAQKESRTLEELVQRWMSDYARKRSVTDEFDDLTQALRGKVRIGRKLTRDELNER